MHELTEQNRRAWNEIADVRQRALWPDAAFFAGGGSLLDARVVAAGGDVRGQALLHLQCATGEETLSWAVAGAVGTGVDISERQIALAKEKATAAGLDVRFITADLYALPSELQSRTFDLVFTGGGALVWLPDIARWAAIVAAALRPGGRLILFEGHPIAHCLWGSAGRIEITDDYFRRGTPQFDHGWAHFTGGEAATETKAEFVWPLGDIITSLIGAGMRIDLLAEYPSDAVWRYGEMLESARRLPGEFLLLASKE